MINQATRMCERAQRSKTHPGYSSFFVSDLLGHLYSIKGSLECVANFPGHGLKWKQKCRAIHAQIMRPDHSEDKRWLDVADMNIVVSLMAEDRFEEALTLSDYLLEQKESLAHRGTQLANKCICLILHRRYDEGHLYCTQAMEVTKHSSGPESAEAAILHYYRGLLHYQQHNLEDALSVLAECLRVRHALMPDHHFTGYVAYKLGVVTRELGDLESSICFTRESFRIANTCLFPDPGQRCRAAFALVRLLNEAGEYDWANSMRNEALELREKLFETTSMRPGEDPNDYDQFISFSHR
ncbi:hypothetical protein M409DRAFT_18524 [Zasmidium cellare ATCC 36951]|uniref:MalT-like TPR region domain-containing protein n=1 Tax=Zasmidium cellare ATCC 36951 TaxID=1080233 RepID=A0A6A6CZ13_ZASCE|nr:uncharacterized protein M409DRAFT_18524 [Zasmidium cellare ATCC 36951]KAF2171408.1 hypothetical protein M409DRAFT_18524 [Zasmidium cellare ATCC 36951]